jgi:MYXO-CTERM domain-containing protein
VLQLWMPTLLLLLLLLLLLGLHPRRKQNR